jgi:hypothetical protein
MVIKMIRIEKYDIKREIEDLVKKIVPPVTPSAGLTFYDYIIEIYDMNNIVVKSASETITLSSLADLNNWIKNTRDKKIMIIAYKPVSDYIALTRNFYYIIGNYYLMINIIEQNTTVIIDGIVEGLYNYDPIQGDCVDISNSIIKAQYVYFMNIKNAGAINTLIANVGEVMIRGTTINYIYIDAEILDVMNITIDTGFIRCLYYTRNYTNVNIIGNVELILGYYNATAVSPNLVAEFPIPHDTLCYDVVVDAFLINDKESKTNPNVYYEIDRNLCKVRIVNNSSDIVSFYIHFINFESVVNRE